MLAHIRESRDTVFTQVEALVEAHPLHPVLTSLPAVGVRTTARILGPAEQARVTQFSD